MSRKNGAKRISDVVAQGDGEPEFLACVALRVELANDYLIPSHICVDRDLDDDFCIARNGGRLGNVGIKRLCWMRTGRAAYSAHRALVPCVEAAGQHLAQGFKDIVGCDEVTMLEEGFELLVDSRRADNHIVELFF